MTTIKLAAQDQHLILLSQAVIASGDRNSVRLTVKTDAAWKGYTVTAAFFRDGERELVLDVPLDAAGSCAIPRQMLAEPCTLNIGIWGRTYDPDVDAESQYKTSSLIRYRVVEGAPIEAGAILVNAANATATEDTVLAGETFYAGAGEAARIGNILTYEEGTPTALTPYTESDPTVPDWAKKPKPPTPAEIGALPAGTKLADLEGDSEHRTVTDDEKERWNSNGGTITQETDPTVPAWAKKTNPPTAADIGAAPAYTYGTEDLTPGVSPLPAGTLYFVYE